jgi:hypothetical protein
MGGYLFEVRVSDSQVAKREGLVIYFTDIQYNINYSVGLI